MKTIIKITLISTISLILACTSLDNIDETYKNKTSDQIALVFKYSDISPNSNNAPSVSINQKIYSVRTGWNLLLIPESDFYRVVFHRKFDTPDSHSVNFYRFEKTGINLLQIKLQASYSSNYFAGIGGTALSGSEISEIKNKILKSSKTLDEKALHWYDPLPTDEVRKILGLQDEEIKTEEEPSKE